MYLPQHFEETNPEAIAGLIEQHPLGTLVTVGSEGINANHIPFLIDTRGGGTPSLIGHVARNNVAWHDSNPEFETLVIFQGPSTYISPTWYLTKAETHQVVPTYNYVVAHIYGPLIVHDDPKWIRGQAGMLTKRMEAGMPSPWKMADAPADYVRGMIENIVGIEIPMQRVIGKWKVSQNRVEADRLGTIAGLQSSGNPVSDSMAELVAQKLNKR